MVNLTQFPCSSPDKAVSVILISDCENLSRKILTAFQERSIHVHSHCLESFPAVRPGLKTDLVILDTGFQVRKGLSLLKEMKSICTHVPVLFLTDNSSEEHVIAAFRLGARDYFTKPLNIPLFMDTVENLLRVKKTCREKRQPLNPEKQGASPTLFDAKTDMPQPIFSSLMYMNNNVTESMSLEAIAKAAGMSKHHFCRVFKKYTGFTPMHALSSMRIERAKKLLESADHTISTVAVESGFGDIGSFIRHFKKVTGSTATDFRNSLRPRN